MTEQESKGTYAILGYVENDESRPNMEILKYCEATREAEAKEEFEDYTPSGTDFLTGEALEIVKTRLVWLVEVEG